MISRARGLMTKPPSIYPLQVECFSPPKKTTNKQQKKENTPAENLTFPFDLSEIDSTSIEYRWEFDERALYLNCAAIRHMAQTEWKGVQNRLFCGACRI